jgi:hypothetical protein
MGLPETMTEGEGNEAGDNIQRGTCPATGIASTGEREPQGPYIHCGEFQAWYARSRGRKGTYGRTTRATRATPEPLADSQKGRVADTPCQQRGREAVVAGGVTTTQGCGEHRGRAKGLSRQRGKAREDGSQ